MTTIISPGQFTDTTGVAERGGMTIAWLPGDNALKYNMMYQFDIALVGFTLSSFWRLATGGTQNIFAGGKLPPAVVKAMKTVSSPKSRTESGPKSKLDAEPRPEPKGTPTPETTRYNQPKPQGLYRPAPDDAAPSSPGPNPPTSPLPKPISAPDPAPDPCLPAPPKTFLLAATWANRQGGG